MCLHEGGREAECTGHGPARPQPSRITRLLPCRATAPRSPRSLPTGLWDAATMSPEARRCGRMPLTQDQKKELIGKFGASDADTGSTKVQIALLTQRISELTEHMKVHKHDHHSRRGLLKLVGRRRRLLTYMQRHDLEGYRALIKELGLRR